MLRFLLGTNLEIDRFPTYMISAYSNVWDWIILLFINLVFDTLTGLVTIKILSVIHRSKSGKAVVLIVIDAILALFFAWACLLFANTSRALNIEYHTSLQHILYFLNLPLD